MTNNDELALKARAEFERWWEVHYHNGNHPRFGWEAYREDGGYKIDDDESELDSMWNAWQAAQNFLLAERDADKKLIAELTHNHRVHAARLLDERGQLKERIADMQAIVDAAENLVRCKGRNHSEQNYRALAALFGVKTPDLPPLETEARELELIVPPRRCFDYAALAVQERDEQWHKALHDACKRAGIKLDVGE